MLIAIKGMSAMLKCTQGKGGQNHHHYHYYYYYHYYSLPPSQA
jgi:hypothetical protein